MDAASAHFSKVVVQWLTENKSTYIRKEDWLSHSPDIGPMDFGVNGMLKARCTRKVARVK